MKQEILDLWPENGTLLMIKQTQIIVYILVRGNIAVADAPVTQVAFKDCAPLTTSITKINGTTIEDQLINQSMKT